MSHDQLAKTLISTFFADFLRLTRADTAPRLRLGEAVFVDKELFTDWPTGDGRELDLLARVPVEQEDVYLLIHVEIESRASDSMRQRLWWYYMQIRLKYRLLVLPILLNLRGGRPGVELVAMEEGFEPLATGMFRYRSLGLSGCRAADWLPPAESPTRRRARSRRGRSGGDGVFQESRRPFYAKILSKPCRPSRSARAASGSAPRSRTVATTCPRSPSSPTSHLPTFARGATTSISQLRAYQAAAFARISRSSRRRRFSRLRRVNSSRSALVRPSSRRPSYLAPELG